MTRPQPYCPPLPQPPAAPIRVDTCETRNHNFRETYTAATQHLRGRRWLHASTTDHRSLFTAHWIYTFSAKEKDVETGLSYFGSRYYSSDLSIWLSVDPMSAKYPSTSPYAYCRNNPIRLVDPNGMFDDEAKATRVRNRAARKYGEERVSGVYNNTIDGGKADYAFSIYGKGKTKYSRSGGTNEYGGPVITCDKADKVVTTRKDFKSYKRSQRGTWNVNLAITGGAQYGTHIKVDGSKIALSANVNIASVDLLGASLHKDVEGTSVDGYCINQSYINANSGFALDPLFSYNHNSKVCLEQTFYSEHSFSAFGMEIYNSNNNIYDPNSGNSDFAFSCSASAILGIRFDLRYHPK